MLWGEVWVGTVPYLPRFGGDSTHRCTSKRGDRWPVECAAVPAMRCVLHERQTPRPLRGYATKESYPKASHTLAKPSAKIQHFRYLRNAWGTKGWTYCGRPARKNGLRQAGGYQLLNVWQWFGKGWVQQRIPALQARINALLSS